MNKNTETRSKTNRSTTLLLTYREGENIIISSLAFIDIETTGVNEKNDKIIQLTVIKTDLTYTETNRKSWYWFHKEIHNTFPLNGVQTSFSDFTGLTEEFLKANDAGKPIMELRDEIIEFIGEDTTLIAFNATFEEKWLNRHIDLNKPWLCLRETYGNMKNRMRGTEKLLLEELGIEFDESKLHNAEYDVEMMIKGTVELHKLVDAGIPIEEDREEVSDRQEYHADNIVEKYGIVWDKTGYTKYNVGRLMTYNFSGVDMESYNISWINKDYKQRFKIK